MKYIFVIIFAAAVCTGCETSVSEYEPKNNKEKDIISLLVKYTTARNNHDAENYLSCFHENSKIMFEPDRYISNNDLRKKIPDIWLQGCPGCIMWEYFNENHFAKLGFINPEISIQGNTANVKLVIKTEMIWGRDYFDLIYENDKWVITRLAWSNML